VLRTRVASGTHARSANLKEQARTSLPSINLQSPADIERLLERSRNLFVPLRIHQINVMFDGPSAKELKETEIRLNAKLHECGCQEGSIAGAVGLLAYVALLLVQVGWSAAWRWKYVGLGVGFCFVMAMLGKAVGLLRARRRLIRQLEFLWTLSQIRNPLNTGE